MTTQDVATTASSDLAIAAGQDFWSEKQIAALAQLGVKGASNGDLAVFWHQCLRTGLDPFARQIYMIGRWDAKEQREKQTIQTGIDGFRLIARRAVNTTGETLGYEDTQWCGADGVWTDVWLSDEAPAAARVAVLRNGQRYPAIALLTEYAATTREGRLTSMWASKPALMLAKCAEALALRKAFPQDLSGLYTTDEMNQADHDPSTSQSRGGETREPVTLQAALDAVEAGETVEDVAAVWGRAAGGLDTEGKATLREAMLARRAVIESGTNPEGAIKGEVVEEIVEAEIVEDPEESASELAEQHPPVQEQPIDGDPDREPITQSQLKAIGQALTALGITVRGDAIAVCSILVGRAVQARTELSFGEARGLRDQLEKLLATTPEAEHHAEGARLVAECRAAIESGAAA